MMGVMRYLALLSFALSMPAAAWAWGCDGHQAVALIAWKQLGLSAKKGIDGLLEANPIDPQLRRFCAPAGLPAIAEVSTWADDYRGTEAGRATGPWHYVDIPANLRSAGDPDAYCAEGCVTRAIEEQLKILKSDAEPAKRAMALRFLIHFVGDLHQPLHAADNNDHGGNCVPIFFFDITPQTATGREASGSYNPNLHGIWDSAMLRDHMAHRDWTVEQLAEHLASQYGSRMDAWTKAPADPRAWAVESWGLAKRFVYGELPVFVRYEEPVKTETCDADNHIGQRMYALHEVVNSRYENLSNHLIEEQLAKAGARLAKLLGSVFQ